MGFSSIHLYWESSKEELKLEGAEAIIFFHYLSTLKISTCESWNGREGQIAVQQQKHLFSRETSILPF